MRPTLAFAAAAHPEGEDRLPKLNRPLLDADSADVFEACKGVARARGPYGPPPFAMTAGRSAGSTWMITPFQNRKNSA